MRDPRTVGLVQIFKGMKGSTDGQIGRTFKKGKAGIHGPPIWSKFLKGDEGSTDHRLVQIFKEDEGIHGPPIRSKFLKGDEGSTDRPFGFNF